MDATRPAPTEDLESVFLALRPELLRRARAIDPAGDPDDVIQDVWIRLSRTTETVAHPRAYLMRMVYTAVLDRRRSRRRAAVRDGSWIAAHRIDGPGSTPPDGESVLLARERLASLEARLEALGEPANSIFRRYRFGGEPQRQIAADLGIALRTVEKHLHRAYAAVHQLRGEQDD